MFEETQYQLLDFGNGRKLEKFGGQIVDRPSPSAENSMKRSPELWKEATLIFNKSGKQTGNWSPKNSKIEEWRVNHADVTFELRPTPAGHLGLFVEQAENWDWIGKQVRRLGTRLSVLNLFAYTGGSTLAAAAAGASVVHVDSAKNIVAWARHNAESSKLGQAPIRWIVEDCMAFVQREIRRGNSYDAIIMDPPSYGHGPKGETWKLSTDLMPLLRACSSLLSEKRGFILVTCHSPGFGAAELSASVDDAFFGHCQTGTQSKKLAVRNIQGRSLNAGVVARWP